jgi:hypothetical protein
MYYIILYVSILIPLSLAIHYALMLRNYKIHLNQVFHSYRAANENLSEGKRYEEVMDKLMDDLDIVFYH